MKKYLLPLFIYLCMSMQAFAAEYQYSLTWLTPNTHTYIVEARTESQTDTYTVFKIPAWRPGRYIMQDYSGAISHFEAWGSKMGLFFRDRNVFRIYVILGALAVRKDSPFLRKNVAVTHFVQNCFCVSF